VAPQERLAQEQHVPAWQENSLVRGVAPRDIPAAYAPVVARRQVGDRSFKDVQRSQARLAHGIALSSPLLTSTASGPRA
jgi:hypothetical protein